MSTKFVSKHSQLMIVLKPGISGSIITGQQSQPGLYVRFKDGFVDVKDENIAGMMRRNAAFGTDFIEVEDKELDPFKEGREEIEPIHKTTDLKYGHVEKMTFSRQPKLPPELRKVIQAEAAKLARQMLPDMLKETLKAFAQAQSANKAASVSPDVSSPDEETEVPGKKPVGRPAKKVEAEGGREVVEV